MKFLVVFSLFLCAALGQLDGQYHYLYNTDRTQRSEIRHPNGTVTGSYRYVDDNHFTHDVEYKTGADKGFTVTSHVIAGNGQFATQNTDQTLEIQDAGASQISFQNYLKNVLPQDNEEEYPPVYIRHVPSPVKHIPNVPITPLRPLQKRQIVHTEHIYRPSQKVIVVNDVPANAQLGARSLFVENFSGHIGETPLNSIPKARSFDSQHVGQFVQTHG